MYTSDKNTDCLPVDLEAVRSAQRAIRDLAVETPLLRADSLSEISNMAVHLKLETLQPTGSFKIRGAANLISRLPKEWRGRTVVCASTGNHGRAVAYAARALGYRAIVCLSSLVPKVKEDAIAALGAETRRVGTSQDDAMAEAAVLVRDEGCIPVPPFDHPDIVAGQGTIGLELIAAVPDLDSVIVPLSGGGLIAGIATAVKALRPGVQVIGVSMERGAAMQASLAAGRLVEVVEEPTLADSLGGGIGLDNRFTFALCRHLVDRVVLVSEIDIYRAISHLFRCYGLVTEGAGAVGAAALLSGRLSEIAGSTVVVVSGRNIDPDQFLTIAAGKPVEVGSQVIRG